MQKLFTNKLINYTTFAKVDNKYTELSDMDICSSNNVQRYMCIVNYDGNINRFRIETIYVEDPQIYSAFRSANANQ